MRVGCDVKVNVSSDHVQAPGTYGEMLGIEEDLLECVVQGHSRL
jgi:hypothetical protein